MTTAILTPDQLLTAHAKAISERENIKTTGRLAGATRRINLLELEMTLQSIEFTPWVEPVKPTTRKGLSDDELIERIQSVQKVADDDAVIDRIRNTASNLVEKLTADAEKRGLTVPTDAPDATDATDAKPVKGRKVAAAAA